MKKMVLLGFLLIMLVSSTIGCNLTKEEISEDYKLKSNVIYYVLNDEYLDNNENDSSKLVMQFMCYDGVKENIYPYTNVVALDKVNTIEESRIKLFKESPNELRLPDNTIVSQNVLSKWKIQNYDGIYSYTDTSPKGLSYLSFK